MIRLHFRVSSEGILKGAGRCKTADMDSEILMRHSKLAATGIGRSHLIFYNRYLLLMLVQGNTDIESMY